MALTIAVMGVVNSQAMSVALDVSGGTVGSDGDSNGWRFMATDHLIVSDFGTYDHNGDGLPSDVDVGLYTDAGALLGMATVPAGTGATLMDGFRYVTLGATIDLFAGNYYRSASSPTSGSLEYLNDSAIVEGPGISFDNGAYSSSGFPNMISTDPEPDFFGPNFKYSTPDAGSTALLMALGLAGLGLVRKRMR